MSNFSLNELSKLANTEARLGDECFKSALEHYKNCGQYLTLAKARGKVEQGSKFRWSEWLSENFNKSHVSCRRYMQLYKNWDVITSHEDYIFDMGINSALKLLQVTTIDEDVEVKPSPRQTDKYIHTVTHWLTVDELSEDAKQHLRNFIHSIT